MADAGPGPCTNTDPTQINIDSSGWACGNNYGIQGAWYCYTDGMGTSSCQGTGYVPYSASSSAMCISGSTSSPPSSTIYGAGVGLVLNQAEHDVGKSPYNASSKNVVGFAVTIAGDSGGSVLNINFPTSAANTASPSVTVPGVSSSSSPVTYSVLFADAAITYNNKTPVSRVDPTSVYGLEVAMPADAVNRNYNYCVMKVVPLTAAPAAPSSCGSAYGPTFTNQTQVVVEGLGSYGVQNDVFGASDPMTMQAFYGTKCAGFSATTNFDTTGSNTPGAFPSVVYGWGLGGNFYGGADPGGYAGGKTIAALASATTSWSFTPGNGNYWDAAYDTWFAQNPNPLNAGLELMVWVARGSAANPLGGSGSPVQGQICGANWNVATGTNGSGQPVVTYIRSSNTTSVNNCDLKGFFMDAANNGRGGLSSGWYLLGIEAGFELYQQGTWTTSSYSVSVQ
jgi:hypothetical protein